MRYSKQFVCFGETVLSLNAKETFGTHFWRKWEFSLELKPAVCNSPLKKRQTWCGFSFCLWKKDLSRARIIWGCSAGKTIPSQSIVLLHSLDLCIKTFRTKKGGGRKKMDVSEPQIFVFHSKRKWLLGFLIMPWKCLLCSLWIICDLSMAIWGYCSCYLLTFYICNICLTCQFLF